MTTAISTDPRTVERPIADLRPGDRIHTIRSARTGEWTTLKRPLLVTHALAPVNLGGPEGVRVFSRTGIDHVLYPGSIDVVEALRERGYASRDAAVRAATKAAGWSTKGGCYFRPIPGSIATFGYRCFEYTGVKGLDQAGPSYVRKGWVVAAGTRWFVTYAPTDYAARVAAQDAQIAQDTR